MPGDRDELRIWVPDAALRAELGAILATSAVGSAPGSPDLSLISEASDDTPVAAAIEASGGAELPALHTLVVADPFAAHETRRLLALGAFDVVRRPLDAVETTARLRAVARSGHAVAALDRSERSRLDEALTALGALSRRIQRPLGLVVAAADHWARVATDVGVVAANVAMRVALDRARQCVRLEDVVGRWSHDTLVVIAPATDLDGAWRLGERIREAVAERPVGTGAADVVLTVSVGVASGLDDPDILLARAEAAMADAARSGHNRVVAAV